MSKYHINPETGEPGECKAKLHCRFGSADEHYTSPEAARAAYENGWESFSPVQPSPAELFNDARTMIAGAPLTKDTYDGIPPGSLLIEYHYESASQKYYLKRDDGKVVKLSADSTRVSISRAVPVPEASLFTRGSKGFHETKSPFNPHFSFDQLAYALRNKEEAADEVARAIHELWRSKAVEPRIGSSTVDGLISKSFDDLPFYWQEENRDSAKDVLGTLQRGVNNHWKTEDMASSIHNSWIQRNKDRAPADQVIPYADLPRDEQLKDIRVLQAAAEVISNYPRSMSNG